MSTCFGRAIRTLFVSLIYVLTYLLMQNVVALVLGLLGMYAAVSPPAGINPRWAFDNAISSNIFVCVTAAMLAAFALYAVFGVLRERPIGKDLRLRWMSGSVMLSAALLALGCRLAVSVYTVLSKNVAALSQSLENAPDYSGAASTPYGYVFSFVSMMLLGPVFEETLFRGFVQSELMRGFPPTLAVIISSLLFGAAHGMLFQSVFAFFVGLIFGWCYYVTGNLATSIMAHLIFNVSPLFMRDTLPDDPLILTITGLTAAALIASGGALLYSKRPPREETAR